MNVSASKTEVLSGIVTSLQFRDTYNTTIMIIDGKHHAYLKMRLSSIFQGNRLDLIGEWKESRKHGRIFIASEYQVPEKRWKHKNRSMPFSQKLFGKQADGLPMEVFQTAEKLESILRPLIDMGKKRIAQKIARSVKTEKALEVRDNPYILYFNKFIPFELAEILHLHEYDIKRPGAADHQGRIRAATHNALDEAYESGKSCLQMSELKKAVLERIGIDLSETIQDDMKDVIVWDYDRAYLPKVYYNRKRTLDILTDNPTLDHLHFHDENIQSLLENRYTILTGPAGSGKTTILRAIAATLDGRVAMTALTGKAASVLSDEAHTLHRLLGFGRKGFSVKELNYDLVIVDEASMLDWQISYALFRVARGRVILCGDDRQLPPVKGGSVFEELLSVLPVVALEKVHRFVGGKNNIACFKMKTARELIGNVIGLSKRLKRMDEDFQVITPVKGDVIGTFKLNAALQQHLNPDGEAVSEKYRTGDRVIVTKNCYRKEVPAFNGQLGFVIEKDLDRKNSVYVELTNGHVLPFYETEIELAYCLTVHKAQGSQFDRVIFISPDSKYGEFMDEKMVYTGTTRGRVKTYILKV